MGLEGGGKEGGDRGGGGKEGCRRASSPDFRTSLRGLEGPPGACMEMQINWLRRGSTKRDKNELRTDTQDQKVRRPQVSCNQSV